MTTEAKLWVHVIPAVHWGVYQFAGKKTKNKTHVRTAARLATVCFASSSGHVFELVIWAAKVYLQGVV